VLGYIRIAVKSGHRCFAMNAGVQQTTQSKSAISATLAIKETWRAYHLTVKTLKKLVCDECAIS
jgi:hypothetical protein